MAKETMSTFPSTDKLKIIKFILKHFNNFSFGVHTNLTIEVNQPIPTKVIIMLSNFSIRNNYEMEITDKLITFLNPLNNE